MPEWLIERGIGETRYALVDHGEIIEARIQRDEVVPAGTMLSARLANIGSNGRNAVAVGIGGGEYLLPRGAPGATQGSTITIEVTREAIPGPEPWKRPIAMAVPAGGSDRRTEQISGRELVFPAPQDELGSSGWNDVIDEARSGVITFAGGELRISPTPAMTLIDVDGHLPPGELAALGATEAARAIRRLDIGGSIGIDLPTVAGKSERQSIADVIDANLPKPFERTTMNGFGFVQVVRPRLRASLVELAQDRAIFEARALLRNSARGTTGQIRVVAHPAVAGVLKARRDWLGALARQVGGRISLRTDAAIPMSGGYAENA